MAVQVQHYQKISISKSSTGQYIIDPVPDIPMQKRKGVIQWDIITLGWNFDSVDGIWFKTNGDQMENTPGQIPGHPNCWQANDLNNTHDVECRVEYGIKVVKGGIEVTKDPTIVNGQGSI
jgi:hypothetical protein